MMYAVRPLPIALADSEEIYRWLTKRSLQGAANWYAALLNVFDELSHDPHRFVLAPERNLGLEVRQRLFKTRRGNRYRLLFTIEGNQVKVLRIRGPGQPPVKRKDLKP